MNKSIFQFFFRFSFVLSLILGVLTLNGDAVKAAPGVNFSVNQTADGDDAIPGNGICETAPGNNLCTLRAAIREANALIGADTITLPAGVYTLTLVGSDDTAAAGDLDILDHLTINGAGRTVTIIDANGAVTNDRALHIPNFSSIVSINGVTVRGGKSPQGGGLYNMGSLTISNSLFTANEAISASPDFVRGGAIFNDGQLIVSDTTFSLNKATATDQNAYGGAIYIGNMDAASFTKVIFEDNQAKGGGIYYSVGGGLYNWGYATLEDCTFSSNEALHFDPTSSNAHGGAIYNNRQMSIQRSTLTDNSAQRNGGGIYIVSGGELTVQASTVRIGSAWDGGGLYMEEASNTQLENTVVSDNKVTHYGGGIYSRGTLILLSSKLLDNQAGNGGGLANLGELVIHSSLISGNTASSLIVQATGGGIFQGGSSSASVIETTIQGNQAEDGGGIYHQGTYTMTVSGVTLSANQASSNGAGIYNNGPLVIQHSTLSANLSNLDGGGLMNNAMAHLVNSTLSGNEADQDGGGIHNLLNGDLFLSNVTVTLNKADRDANSSGNGGGIYNTGSVNLKHSVIAENDDMTLIGTQYDDCFGTLVSDGYNLLGNNTGCSGLVDGIKDDQVGTGASPIDPELGILTYNGGLTLTHLPQAGSPLIDHGNPWGCHDYLGSLLFLDQRDYWRPVDGNVDGTAECDIGAVEYLSVAARFLFLPNIFR